MGYALLTMVNFAFFPKLWLQYVEMNRRQGKWRRALAGPSIDWSLPLISRALLAQRAIVQLRRTTCNRGCY